MTTACLRLNRHPYSDTLNRPASPEADGLLMRSRQKTAIDPQIPRRIPLFVCGQGPRWETCALALALALVLPAAPSFGGSSASNALPGVLRAEGRAYLMENHSTASVKER